MNWSNERRKLSELKEYEHNPRRLTETQHKRLKEGIEQDGLSEVPIINADGTIIAGHQRIRILKELGETEVDCRIADSQLTELDFQELNIRDNKNHGTFDYEILYRDFQPEELYEFGFSETELERNPPILVNAETKADLKADKEAFDNADKKQLVLLFLEDEYAENVEKIGHLLAVHELDKPADLVKMLIEAVYLRL